MDTVRGIPSRGTSPVLLHPRHTSHLLPQKPQTKGQCSLSSSLPITFHDPRLRSLGLVQGFSPEAPLGGRWRDKSAMRFCSVFSRMLRRVPGFCPWDANDIQLSASMCKCALQEKKKHHCFCLRFSALGL